MQVLNASMLSKACDDARFLERCVCRSRKETCICEREQRGNANLKEILAVSHRRRRTGFKVRVLFYFFWERGVYGGARDIQAYVSEDD